MTVNMQTNLLKKWFRLMYMLYFNERAMLGPGGKKLWEGKHLVWEGYSKVHTHVWMRNKNTTSNKANNGTQPGLRSVGPHSAHLWLFVPLGELSIHLETAFAFFLGDKPSISFPVLCFRGRTSWTQFHDPSLTPLTISILRPKKKKKKAVHVCSITQSLPNSTQLF